MYHIYAEEKRGFMDNQNKVQKNTQTDMMVARQAQEVQVAMLSAKKFPRDELSAINRIKATCQRPTLAEQAVYTYPRGGQKVSGPSIRLAEALAQNWGNLDTGIIELENRNGKSEMMAYAWDLETNTRVTKTFSVDHVRDTKQGRKDLTDARDIYEATANFGARRMRACILSVIPGDVVDMAVQECRKTLADKDQRPVNEILNELLKAFKKIDVTKEMLEKYVDKQLTDLLKEDLVDLRGVYKSINDGQSKASDYFKDLEFADVKASETKKSAIIAANKTDEVVEDISDESIEQGLDQAIEEAKEHEQGELIGEVASNGGKNSRGKSRNQKMEAN
jgi:hypothetical protein